MFSFLYVIWTRDESNKSSSFSICSFLDLEFRPSQQPSLIFCIFFNEFLTERIDVVKNKTKYKTTVLNIMRFVHSSSYLISRRLRPALCDSQNDTAFRFRLATENSLWREYILEKYFLRVSDKTPLCLCVTWLMNSVRLFKCLAKHTSHLDVCNYSWLDLTWVQS